MTTPRRVPPPLQRRQSTVSDFLRRKSFVGTDEVKEMKDLFRMCDSNSDGIVSKKELLVMMRSMGIEPPKSEFNLLWDQLDTNKDGAITFDEFLNGMNWLKKGIALAEEIGDDGEDDAEDAPAAGGKQAALEDKVEVLSKYVQLVLDNGIKQAKALLAANNKSGAQAILDMLDLPVVTEMEKALGEKLMSKELRAMHEEVLKALKK